MSLGRYVVGLALLAVMVVPLLLAARRVRRRMVPTWAGALAGLADAILVVSFLCGISQLLGSVGLFRDWSIATGSVLVGAAVLVLVRPAPSVERERPPRVPIAEAGAAFAAVTLLGAQWVTWIAQAFHYGIANSDSVWYVLPFGAHFARSGSLTAYHFVNGEALVPYYPANASLLHGLGMLAFKTDVLSVVLNVVAAALALTAGWCIGRRWNQGPAGLIAVVIPLTLVLMTESMAGSAKDDLFAIAFLLASMAFVFHTGSKRSGPFVLAGLAAGLAISTKLTMIGPIGALVLGVLVLAGRKNLRSTLVTFGLPFLATGSFWYVRNLISVGNPIPALGQFLQFLPLRDLAPTSYERFGGTLADHLFDVDLWRLSFLPGISYHWGRVAPFVALAAIVGTVAILVRGRGLDRVAVFAVVGGVVSYMVTPGSAYATDVFFKRGANIGAINWLFGFNTRYAVPVVILALAVLPAVRVRGRPKSHWPLLVFLLGCLAVAQTGASSSITWYPGRGNASFVMAIVIVVIAAVVWLARRFEVPRWTQVTALAASALVLFGLGFPVARDYVTTRYTAVETDAFVRAHGHTRYAIAGFAVNYPFFGAHLENDVEYIGKLEPDGSFHPYDSCLAYRRALREGHYHYVAVPTSVVTLRQGYDLARWNIDLPGGEPPLAPPEAKWSKRDPHQSVAYAGPEVTIYRVHPGVTATGCPTTGRR